MFGVAAHPTTRLCLELLISSQRTALADWGCGSGVLAIAGARLGFAPVVAVELDEAAAYVARSNAAANGADVEVLVGDVTRAAPWAPTVVANLTLPLLEAAAAAAGGEAAAPSGEPVAPDGSGASPGGEPVRLIASGFLAARAGDAAAAWAPLGFVERERRVFDGWAAVVLERA